MIEGQRVILSHAIKGSLTLISAPEGLFNLEYVLTRSEQYHGLVNQFSGRLGFVKDGKDYIDDVISVYKKEAEVTFSYYFRDPITLVYELFIEGILNLGKFSQEIEHTYVDFESTSFNVKLNRRIDIELPYNRLESIGGTSISAATIQFINLLCEGMTNSIVTKSVYPFEAFENIIKQIVDSDNAILYSELLGRIDRGNSVDGELCNRLLTKGTWLRGWDNTTDNMYFSLQSLFDIIDKQKPCGLGSETSGTIDRVRIEDREYFYQSRIAMTFDDDRIQKDSFRYEPADEFAWNKLTIGFEKGVKEDVEYGLAEFNTKVEYSNTSKTVNKELNLVNKARGDGSAINDIINNFQGGIGSDGSDYDKDIFIIDSKASEGEFGGKPYTMKNKTDDGYTSWSDSSGLIEQKLLYNLDLSPARVLITQFGKWLNISLQDLEGVLKYNKAETLSFLTSLRATDSVSVNEKMDILLTALETPIMTGGKFYFNYPLNYEEIKNTQDDFYGQRVFTDPRTGVQAGGWLKEISTNPQEESANIIIFEAKTLAEALGLELNEDGGYALSEDGTFILLENG